jgi:hypothetical protein
MCGNSPNPCALLKHKIGAHRAVPAGVSSAQAESEQTVGRTLIFGGGDEAAAGLGINPTESLTNLEGLLTGAGYNVEVSATLPKKLTPFKAVWFVNTDPLTSSQESELETYVESGHGLYLTGEADDCCGTLNSSDGAVINLLKTGGGIEVGGQGQADVPSATNTVMSGAIDSVAVSPDDLTGWNPTGPAGLGGVGASNVLTTTTFEGVSKPTGAVWDGSSLIDGRGRLAILMNINWLESEFWNQATATQMAVNLERFLTAATPVSVGTNSQWAGYAAKAPGVRDVNGQWTVPTVECSKVSEASAVGIWVGIDGFGDSNLVKAGVGATCASSTATPCYYLFTEILPGSESPVTGCSGVAAGDDLQVDVTNSPYGSSVFDVTFTDNGNVVDQPIVLTARNYSDKSAECVVQLPPGKVGPTPARYKQLADFGSVSFSQCQATATEDAGTNLDVDQLASGSDDTFAVTALNMGTKTTLKATTGFPIFPNPGWTVSWVG